MSKQYPLLQKAWYQRNKEKVKAKTLEYYHKNKDELLPKMRPKQKIYAPKYKKKLRDKLFDILGHKCVKCGFDDKRALQFDHIDGGGIKEMREIFKHNNDRKCKFYIANPNMARKTLQILCSNCNWIKRYENNELTGKGKK